MIEKIEDINELDSWKIRDIYTIRILALLESYGTKYHFATFYKQTIDGKITAIISKLDNDVTLSVDDGFDNTEIVHFMCVTGYNTLLCDDRPVLSSRFEEGIVMECITKREAVMQGAVIDEYPKLMDLYNFVDYEGQDFKAWYVDISHRVRHGTARAYTLEVSDEIISSGILSSIYEKYAILTAVRTVDEFRRMGYGSTLVTTICSDINGPVYIMRDANRNESFYTKLGFKNIGKWRMYK